VAVLNVCQRRGARCTLSNSYSGRRSIVSRIRDRDDLGALSGRGQQANNYSPQILVYFGVVPWLQERGHPPSEPVIASGHGRTKVEVNEYE
jgi:hypothetical protein